MPAEQRSAWLFDFGAGLRAAVAGRNLAEYLRAPQVVEVPLAPAHARGVLVWRERLVPLLDLARLAGGVGESIGAIVLAYREAPQSPLQYGALTLSAAPREIGVHDGLACELPAEPGFWSALAASCITHEDRPTPILRVRNLFTRSFAESDARLPAPRLLAIPAARPEASADPIRAVDLDDVATRETFDAGIAPSETAPAPLTIVVSKESAATAAIDENSFDAVPVVHEAIPEAVRADQASRPNPPLRTPEIARRHRPAGGPRVELGKLPRGILEIERHHRPPAFRWLRRLLVVGAAVLAALFLWSFLTAPGATRAPEPAGSRAQPALDVAPNKVEPAAVPAAPVQPPN